MEEEVKGRGRRKRVRVNVITKRNPDKLELLEEEEKKKAPAGNDDVNDEGSQNMETTRWYEREVERIVTSISTNKAPLPKMDGLFDDLLKRDREMESLVSSMYNKARTLLELVDFKDTLDALDKNYLSITKSIEELKRKREKELIDITKIAESLS